MLRYRVFVLASALALALTLLGPTTALATSFTYEASLSGAAEFPANGSPATGAAAVVLGHRKFSGGFRRVREVAILSTPGSARE